MTLTNQLKPGEFRGQYKAISERTLRDDLRVMKSDILGFNAPIEQEKGLYFYSDPKFSILTLNITDAGLADRILIFLTGLRTGIMHPELEFIIRQLHKLTNRDYDGPVQSEDLNRAEGIVIKTPGSSREELCAYPSNSMDKAILAKASRFRLSRALKAYFSADDGAHTAGVSDSLFHEKTGLSWGDVFEKVLA